MTKIPDGVRIIMSVSNQKVAKLPNLFSFLGQAMYGKKEHLYAYQICSEAWSASPQHSRRGTFHEAICFDFTVDATFVISHSMQIFISAGILLPISISACSRGYFSVGTP